jgi:hypothetical protein
MSKLKKLRYLRERIMVLSNTLAKKISRFNQKIEELFNL